MNDLFGAGDLSRGGSAGGAVVATADGLAGTDGTNGPDDDVGEEEYLKGILSDMNCILRLLSIGLLELRGLGITGGVFALSGTLAFVLLFTAAELVNRKEPGSGGGCGIGCLTSSFFLLGLGLGDKGGWLVGDDPYVEGVDDDAAGGIGIGIEDNRFFN
jgi:hypothetical protein